MRLYGELAGWYSLLTPVEGYEEEAGVYAARLRAMLGPGRWRVLELGAGAGHNACWMSREEPGEPILELTLLDLSPQMLGLAAAACPGARRIVGDMRTARLGEVFDAVFIHDAIGYMRTEADLRAVFETARAHLRPGGAILVAPDNVAETFAPGEDCGGSDGGGRSIRYLEWIWQREGRPESYVADYTLVTRVGEAEPVIYHDRHEGGLFPRATWVRLLEGAGFTVEREEWRHSEVDYPLDLFMGRAI